MRDFAEWAGLGLKAVFIGLEAATNPELDSMDKETTVDHNRRAIAVLQKHRVDIYGSLIIQPDYTKEDWDRLKRFIDENKLYYLNISPLTPMPGTLIWEQYKDQVMVPRVRISGIPLGATPQEVREILGTSPHTRYPIYERDLDQIVGIVHIKDLLRVLMNGETIAAEHARPVPLMPETAELDAVLETMRRERTQMVVVLDEHGGTAGIVTLDRPRALNALNTAMRAQIATAFAAWARDPQVYAAVIESATERAFCAGGDVREMVDWGRTRPEDAYRSLAEEYGLNWQLDCFTKPTVSLIDGAVVGSGVGITLYGTHRVAGERYRFAMPETAIGLFPDDGVSWALSTVKGSSAMMKRRTFSITLRSTFTRSTAAESAFT